MTTLAMAANVWMRFARRWDAYPPFVAVSVLIPYRPTDIHRQRALDWVLDRYEQAHPDWEVVVAGCDGEWSKGAAVADGLERAGGEVIVVADADVWVVDLKRAVEQVRGPFSWAIPHLWVYRLTEEATEQVYVGAELDTRMGTVRTHKGVRGGGCVVVDRATMERIPMDPRFTNWGGEDIAWGKALSVLAGEAWRSPRPLFHLFHPLAPRLDVIAGNPENAALLRRYTMGKARSRWPEVMQSVVDEVLAMRSSPDRA